MTKILIDEATVKLALEALIAEYHMENSSFAKRVDCIFKEALAEQPAPVQPDETLLSFYQVTDFPSLVSAMEGHIKKMQSKLQSNPHTAIDAWNNREMVRAAPPAQRTWVGLTDEEAFQICVDCGCLSEDWLTLLDAIEAKLKEKNT